VDVLPRWVTLPADRMRPRARQRLYQGLAREGLARETVPPAGCSGSLPCALVAMPIRERLGALWERDFRLLFGATMITTVGAAWRGSRSRSPCSTMLALSAPAWVVALAPFAGGVGIAVHLTL
jgi:hypothetical protein